MAQSEEIKIYKLALQQIQLIAMNEPDFPRNWTHVIMIAQNALAGNSTEAMAPPVIN